MNQSRGIRKRGWESVTQPHASQISRAMEVASRGGGEIGNSSWSKLHGIGGKKRLLGTDSDTLNESSVGTRLDHMLSGTEFLPLSPLCPTPFSLAVGIRSPLNGCALRR